MKNNVIFQHNICYINAWFFFLSKTFTVCTFKIQNGRHTFLHADSCLIILFSSVQLASHVVILFYFILFIGNEDNLLVILLISTFCSPNHLKNRGRFYLQAISCHEVTISINYSDTIPLWAVLSGRKSKHMESIESTHVSALTGVFISL